MLVAKMARLGIDTRRLNGFREWMLLLSLSTDRRLKDACKHFGIEGKP